MWPISKFDNGNKGGMTGEEISFLNSLYILRSMILLQFARQTLVPFRFSVGFSLPVNGNKIR